MTPLQRVVLAQIKAWAEAGVLRRLDYALARFMLSQDAHLAPEGLLAVAWLAQMEGQGHSCLPLGQCLCQPDPGSGWLPAQRQEWGALMERLPARLESWIAALGHSTCVWQPGQGPDRAQPLVLDGNANAPRLYLRRYWQYEQILRQQITARLQTPVEFDEHKATQVLDQLFVPSAQIDWQKLACAIALRGRVSIITGGPGTGKTYTAARLLALLLALAPMAHPVSHQRRLKVALAAPTGKAAARLKQSIDAALLTLAPVMAAYGDLPRLVAQIGPAQTLHRLLGARPDARSLRMNVRQPLDLDLLIVDEASMVDLAMMAGLLQAIPPHTRVVFLGDKDQLASVEAGAVFADLCRFVGAGQYSTETAAFAQRVAGIGLPDSSLATQHNTPVLAQHTVMLQHSHRFGGPIGQLAHAVNQGNCSAAMGVLAQSNAIIVYRSHATPEMVWDAAAGVYDATCQGVAISYTHYLDVVRQGPADRSAQAHAQWAQEALAAFERVRVLCALREGPVGVEGLNRGIELALQARGWLQARGVWYAGRPVLVTRNDPTLGVFNGDCGLVLPGPTGQAGLKAYFMQGDGLKGISVSRLQQVETAFAMTVHKSQGSEFEHVILVVPPALGQPIGRELLYTGITRAKAGLTLLAPTPEALSAVIAHTTRRVSGLAQLL